MVQNTKPSQQKFLSRTGVDAPRRPAPFLSNSKRRDRVPLHSCRNTLVWQWLDAARPGGDDVGDAVRLMRKRVDMPRSFPNKKYLRAYMEKSRVDDGVIHRTIERLWSMWVDWLEGAKHD